MNIIWSNINREAHNGDDFMTEGSNWDVQKIAPSAWAVAAARAKDTARPNSIVKDEYAIRFIESAHSIAPVGYFENMGIPIEFGSEDSPGSRGNEIRTKFFDNFIKEVQEKRVRQIVLLGAGFDSRAFRLEWKNRSIVYEVDLPDVIYFKEELLRKIHAMPNCTRRSLAADLRDGWKHILLSEGFNPDEPTAWIAEGLVHSLPESDQLELVREIHNMSATGSSFAFQFASFTTNDSSQTTIRFDQFFEKKREEIAQIIPRERLAKIERIIRDMSPADATAEELNALGWSVYRNTTLSLAEEYSIQQMGDNANPTLEELNARAENLYVIANLD